ncbi:hypothetical protein KDM41_13110 [bacterium]|nr:hypothetical protein [bacterium]
MQNDTPLLTVPGLLNILYRGRFTILILTALGLAAGIGYGIVVKPLYRATAQVRPGVVSYNPNGLPNREWALQDITTWFDGFLYWRDLKELPPFQAAKGRPVIRATYIPSLNFVAGGNVITLTNLSTDPGLAALTLDESIKAFNRQARADSMGSSLYLTLRRGEAQIRKLRNDIDLVGAKAERVELDIAESERQLTMIDLRDQELDLQIQRRQAEIAWMTEAVTTARNHVVTAGRRLADAEAMLAVAVRTEQENAGGTPPAGGDPLVEVLKQSATREQAGRVGELLLTVNGLENFIASQAVRADSLESRVKSNELEIGRLRLVRQIDLAKQRADVGQKIRDLNITLERDLPHEREVLTSELETERIKVSLISPLERIGTINVTEKPVRPRKSRAAIILTFLAFCGSVFLVLVWEYLRNNREAIMAPRSPRP